MSECANRLPSRSCHPCECSAERKKLRSRRLRLHKRHQLDVPTVAADGDSAVGSAHTPDTVPILKTRGSLQYSDTEEEEEEEERRKMERRRGGGGGGDSGRARVFVDGGIMSGERRRVRSGSVDDDDALEDDPWRRAEELFSPDIEEGLVQDDDNQTLLPQYQPFDANPSRRHHSPSGYHHTPAASYASSSPQAGGRSGSPRRTQSQNVQHNQAQFVHAPHPRRLRRVSIHRSASSGPVPRAQSAGAISVLHQAQFSASDGLTQSLARMSEAEIVECRRALKGEVKRRVKAFKKVREGIQGSVAREDVCVCLRVFGCVWILCGSHWMCV